MNQSFLLLKYRAYVTSAMILLFVKFNLSKASFSSGVYDVHHLCQYNCQEKYGCICSVVPRLFAKQKNIQTSCRLVDYTVLIGLKRKWQLLSAKEMFAMHLKIYSFPQYVLCKFCLGNVQPQTEIP